MEPRTKVLLTDGFVAALGLAQAWLNRGEYIAWSLAALFGILTVGSLWASEHDALKWVPADGFRLIAFVVAVLGVGILVGGLVLGPDRLEAVLLAGMVGLGVGMLCYRAYFGLVRPVPPTRLERV